MLMVLLTEANIFTNCNKKTKKILIVPDTNNLPTPEISLYCKMEKCASVVDHHTFTIDSKYSFNSSRILGKGSNGIVVKSFDTIRGQDVAIKRIRPYARDKAYAKLLLREIRCLKILGTHPNVQYIIFLN
jgi:serine/threonine protein kinase